MSKGHHFFASFAHKNKRPFIIAEIGTNHGGSFERARKMVIESAKAGADAVKFQLFDPEKLVHPKAKVFDSHNAESQRELYGRLTLAKDQYRKLFRLAERLHVGFFASCWDEQHADFVDNLGAPFLKIGSGDLTHFSLLRHIASKGKPIILSTGMATLAEIKRAIEAMRREGNEDIAVLYCVANYPAQLRDINLNSIGYLAEVLNLPVGYSDHTIGMAAVIAAFLKGATIIEKHYTLDKRADSDFGINNDISMDFADLQNLRDFCSNLPIMLGKREKKVGSSELRNRSLVRRGIYTRREIHRGQKITAEDIICLRPEAGVSAERYDEVINMTAVRPIGKGESLTWAAIKKPRK